MCHSHWAYEWGAEIECTLVSRSSPLQVADRPVSLSPGRLGSSYCRLLSPYYVLSTASALRRLSQWAFTMALWGRYCFRFWKLRLREASYPRSEPVDPDFRKRWVSHMPQPELQSLCSEGFRQEARGVCVEGDSPVGAEVPFFDPILTLEHQDPS